MQSEVTGHGQAHAMPITQSLMQACRSAYSVYNTRITREEKEKKAKEQRLKDQGKRRPKDNKKPRCPWREEAKAGGQKKPVGKEQKKCKEQVTEGLYGEANRRLQKATIDKDMLQRSLFFKASWRRQL